MIVFSVILFWSIQKILWKCDNNDYNKEDKLQKFVKLFNKETIYQSISECNRNEFQSIERKKKQVWQLMKTVVPEDLHICLAVKNNVFKFKKVYLELKKI